MFDKDKVLDLLKGKKWSVYKLAKESNIPQSSMHDILTGKIKNPTGGRLKSIADALGVSIDDLLGGSNNTTVCPDCGFSYCEDIGEDYLEHENLHKKWEKAFKKNGFHYKYIEREQIKNNSRNIFNDNNKTDNEKYAAAIEYFKAYFSRSLERSLYNELHVTFPEYIAMLLNADFAKDTIPENIYDMLIEKYGKKSGIEKGSSYYDIPEKTEIYFDDNFEFNSPENALQFILKQPTFMAYGGYDLNSLTDEEILEIANDMLFAMRLSMEKLKKKK